MLLGQGIPKDVIKADRLRETNTHRERETSLKVIPFVVTYNPILKSMDKVILKNLNLLYMVKEVNRVFTPKPIIWFQSARKLSSYLVRAKLYPMRELYDPISVVENTMRSG